MRGGEDELIKKFEGLEAGYHVLSQGSWPISKEVKGAVIPPQIDDVQSDFKHYYLSRHQGKCLTFVPQMSTSLIFAKFDLNKPTLVK